MKDPKPTKKELATQTRALEEQVTRLKNRLNGQVFKKTKHGYRLDQLSDGAQKLSGRIGELDQQLIQLRKAQDGLAAKWQTLGKETDALKNQARESGGKKRFKEKLGKLKSSISDINLQQRQIGKTLGELQSTVGQVGNVRDDLKLETDELRAQIRGLQENSSRLSVSQSSQESRTRELEGLLAELTLGQEGIAAESKTQAEKAPQQLNEAIAPLQAQLQQLDEFTTNDNGRHKEIDRRLQDLANKIGDLGGRLSHLDLDLADQRQQRERLTQELNPRLQQLEVRVSDIDALEENISAPIKQETDTLRHKQEETGSSLSQLVGEIDELRRHLQQLVEGNEDQTQAAQQSIESKIVPLVGELALLQNQASESASQHESLLQTLDGINGQITGLTDQIHSVGEHAEQQLQEAHQQLGDIEPRLQRLEQNSSDINALQVQLNTLSSREQTPEVNQKLKRVEDEISRLIEAENFLQESFRGLGGLELNLTSRLDDLQRQWEGRTAQSRESEEAIQRLSKELSDIVSNLQKLEQTDLSQQEQLHELEQKQKILIEPDQSPNTHQQEVDGQLDRIEEACSAERERVSQFEGGLSRVRDDSEVQKLELEESKLTQQALELTLEQLDESIAKQTEQGDTLLARVEEQADQQHALAHKIDEQAKQQQALTERVDAQTEKQLSLTGKVAEQVAQQQETAQKFDERAGEQQTLLQANESVNEVLASLEQRGQQSNSKITDIEQEQHMLRSQIEAEKSKIEEQTQALQALATKFNTIDANGEAQQQSIKKNETTGKTHRLALIGLLLLGMLGGLALHFSNSGQIAESELRITQNFISPDPRYITWEGLSDKLKTLESSLAKNSQRINKVATEQPPESLRERQSELEQQLARLEVRLNLVSAGAQGHSTTNGESAQLQTPQLKLIQLDIQRINDNLAELSVTPSGDSEDKRLVAIEQSLVDNIELLGARISKLETDRPATDLNRITAIERSFNETRALLGERLNNLESDTTDTDQRYQLLEQQVQTLSSSVASINRTTDAPTKMAPAFALQAGAPHRYSIQLAGSRNLSSLIAFAADQSLQQEAAYFRTTHEARDWYILLYGTYSNFSDASTALESLPSALSRYRPWIRKTPQEAKIVR